MHDPGRTGAARLQHHSVGDLYRPDQASVGSTFQLGMVSVAYHESLLLHTGRAHILHADFESRTERDHACPDPEQHERRKDVPGVPPRAHEVSIRVAWRFILGRPA